jgi:hypothetical protein
LLKYGTQFELRLTSGFLFRAGSSETGETPFAESVLLGLDLKICRVGLIAEKNRHREQASRLKLE